jgi:glycosyltransferase involved in cell wall biosynthesis
MPKITVLIPTFNRAEYLGECLDSILAQTVPATQIIVVDDGSTDNTEEVLKPYMNNIEYLRIPQQGKPSAINHGLRMLSGDYLWIFDDDDVALPDALERFVAPLEKYPDYGFSFSTFFYASTSSENDKIGSILWETKIPDLTTRGFLIPLLEADFIGGAALFARVSCYQKVGRFDPGLIRSQDYEMAIRIARNFKGVQAEGGATFHYRQHKGTRGTQRYNFHFNESTEKWLQFDQMFFRNLYSEIALWEYLPVWQSLDDYFRLALLQRISIMASKFLLPEIINDLKSLALLNQDRLFSKEEKDVISKMLSRKFYKSERHIFTPLFCGEIRVLARSSGAIRLLRREIAKSFFSLYILKLKKIEKYFYYILMLYVNFGYFRIPQGMMFIRKKAQEKKLSVCQQSRRVGGLS